MCRLEFANSAHDALRARRCQACDEIVDGCPIETTVDIAQLQNRLQLRSKNEAATEICVIQRFDAESIARKEKLSSLRVPDCKCEHSAQLLHEIGTEILIEVNDHFGVRARGEFVAAVDQLLPKRLEVVNLAVEDDPHGSVFIRNGLMTGMQIDDAQASHAHSDMRRDKETLVVRPTVHEGRAHTLDVFSANGPFVEVQNSCDA